MPTSGAAISSSACVAARRSQAARQYALLKNKMRRQFGEEPEFTLTDLSAAAAGDQPQAGSLLSADPATVAVAR